MARPTKLHDSPHSPKHANAWQWTADGPITACALKLVEAELSPGLAATLHPRTTARLALEMKRSCAIHKHVQVCLAGENPVLPDGCVTSLADFSVLTILYMNNHMRGHIQLLFSLTSDSKAVQQKHEKTARRGTIFERM